ncbi:MAG: toll/interleukin-1 receptor domain-containing protein, partial [Lachnospiraceae bacterium]|nr:toll/interleukin-1 receptor domain-containing protein [Lachnospiraceae bacterium]
EKGYHVFYSRVSLLKHSGENYEPYIFAALNSARVMLLLGSCTENISSVWVKNEWQRYLKLCENTPNERHIIPVIRDMLPEELPAQLNRLESISVENTTWLVNLENTLEKFIRKKKTPSMIGNVNPVALLSRGKMALEDREWERADSFFDQVLNIDAENGEAYLGQFLAGQNVSSIEELRSVRLAQSEQALSTELEAKPDDGGVIEECVNRFTISSFFTREEILDYFSFDGTYESDTPDRKKQLEDEMEFWEKDANLRKFFLYADLEAKEQLEQTKELIRKAMEQRILKAEEEDKESIESVEEEYKEFLIDTEKELEEEMEERIEDRYDGIRYWFWHEHEKKGAMNENIACIVNMMHFYETAKYCSQPSELKLDKWLERLKKAREFRKKIPFIIAGACACIFFLIFTGKEVNYRTAKSKIRQGEVGEAYNILTRNTFFSSYKNSKTLSEFCREYMNAMAALEDNDYNYAAETIYDVYHSATEEKIRVFKKICEKTIAEYSLDTTNGWFYMTAVDLAEDGEELQALQLACGIGDYVNSKGISGESEEESDDAEKGAHYFICEYLDGGWVSETVNSNSLLWTIECEEASVWIYESGGAFSSSEDRSDAKVGNEYSITGASVQTAYGSSDSYTFTLDLKNNATGETCTLYFEDLDEDSFTIGSEGYERENL